MFKNIKDLNLFHQKESWQPDPEILKLLPPGFSFEVTGRLDRSITVLPENPTQFFDEYPDNRYFILKNEQGQLIAFTVIKLPKEKTKAGVYYFFYVHPNHRRRGYAPIMNALALSSYAEQGYKGFISMIHNVVRIDKQGKVHKNFAPDLGGWASYATMTKENGIKVSRKVLQVSIDDGVVTLDRVLTELNPQTVKVLPNNPEQLLDHLRQTSIIPRDYSNTELYVASSSNPETEIVFPLPRQSKR